MNIFLKSIIKITVVWSVLSHSIGLLIAFLINSFIFNFYDPIFYLIRLPISFSITFLIWFVVFYFYYKMLILINLREWYKDE